MNRASIGDALNIPESVVIDAPWRNHRHVKRLLSASGIKVKHVAAMNKGLFPRRRIMVIVDRYQGQMAMSVLSQNGYTIA